MQLRKKHALMIMGGLAAGAAGAATNATANASAVTVQKGDTTWGLAQKNHTTVSQIVKDNHLSNNGELIYVGETLAINSVSDNDSDADQAEPSQTNTSAQGQQDTTQAAPQAPQSYQGQATGNYAAANTNAANNSNYSSSVSGGDAAAKAWIASRESGGNYNARNGQYVGKYQLSSSYLGGDYSPAHQEQVADQYVAGRYGSWSNAQAFWQAHGWY